MTAAQADSEPEAPARPQLLRGINLAAADFGEEHLPGQFGKHYTYPSPTYVPGYSSPAYFVSKGMDVFRLPFRWERLQRELGEPFAAEEHERLSTTVAELARLGAKVILDPHNYARYAGSLIGSEAVSYEHFADLWTRLAEQYKGDPQIIFGLMNEPHDMPTEQWVEAANLAIAAIRETGADNLILVPGNAWTGAHSWSEGYYGTPNAVAMLRIEDPGDNFAFDVHQYLDGDASGTEDECVSERIGVERMRPFTDWAKQHGRRGFLGEFNGGNNELCRTAVTLQLEHVEQNTDVYLGWTWWAAGPWWGDALRILEPTGGTDTAQMAWLEPFLSP